MAPLTHIPLFRLQVAVIGVCVRERGVVVGWVDGWWGGGDVAHSLWPVYAFLHILRLK